MELIFVRHAQPAWVDGGRSVLDPGLTELGRRQAEALAASGKHWSRADVLAVSPTRRTRETAEPLASALGLEPRTVEWFEEIRLPRDWDGAPADHVGGLLRSTRTRTHEEWRRGIDGAEAFEDFHRRITAGLDALLEELGARPTSSSDPGSWAIDAPELRVVVVGHGGSNAVAIGHLLGLHPVPWPWERLVSLHASISRVKATALRGGFIFGLRDHSNVAHLEKPLRSR